MELEIHQPDGIRLQKVLASAGLGSRRACEELIARGRVKVDGEVVDQVGVRVDPDTVAIEVDNKRIATNMSEITIMLNKPKGVVSTMSDPQGRPALDRYVSEYSERLFHVGRLDADTTGLLLLTNNGELANRLAHPSYGVSKRYVAHVQGRVPRNIATILKQGVELDDGPVRVSECHVTDSSANSSIVEVVLHEGRNRIVRRLFDAVGHPVIDLVRTQFGPVRLGTLAQGRSRELSRTEMGELLNAAGL